MNFSDCRLTMTKDRIAIFEKETGCKFESDGKLCDFCDCKLPITWISIQCIRCPTIFDSCDACSKNHQPGICHQQHKDGEKQQDSLTVDEKDEIRKTLSPRVMVYSETLAPKDLCQYCAMERDQPGFDSEKCEQHHLQLVSLRKIIDGDTTKFAKLIDLCKKNDVLVQVLFSCGSMTILF